LKYVKYELFVFFSGNFSINESFIKLFSVVLSYNKKPPQQESLLANNQWSQLYEAKILLRAEPNLLFRKTEYLILYSFLAGKINRQITG